MELMTKSNVKAVINPASFKEAMALKSAIGKEVSASSLEFELGDLSSMNDIDVASMGKFVALIDSSENVYDKLFDCLGRCTYNGDRITEKTFEPVEAREDYYEIVIECLKANLTPFFKALFSK